MGSLRDASAVARFTERKVTLIFDNTYETYKALSAIGRDVLLGWDGLTLDTWQAWYANGPGGDSWDLARAAGDAVAGEVRGWIDGLSVRGEPGASLLLLLGDLLDFGDSEMWAHIGWNYLPEPSGLDADDFDGYEDSDEEESA